MSLEKTLEVFQKRTPEEKQQYIYELVRENNQLRNELTACLYSLSLYGEKETKLRREIKP